MNNSRWPFNLNRDWKLQFINGFDQIFCESIARFTSFAQFKFEYDFGLLSTFFEQFLSFCYYEIEHLSKKTCSNTIWANFVLKWTELICLCWLQLTGVLSSLSVKNTYKTPILARKQDTHKKKNSIPNMSTIIGCWGGNFPQCSSTTSLSSSGKPSRCDAPGSMSYLWIISNVMKFVKPTFWVM